MEKPRLRVPILVEGKYDQITLSSMVEGEIICCDGFQIFKNEELVKLLRRLTENNSIAILTDSDRAGFLIRNHISGILPVDKIIPVYIPEIKGKEKRKAVSSKDGLLGVEGMKKEVLLPLFRQAGILEDASELCCDVITKADLFRLGLSGGPNARGKRVKLLQALDLPTHLSANQLPRILSRFITLEKLEDLIDTL